MEPAEFGQLVKSLRKATNDPSGNPWTRESLSIFIHLSINQLGRLERGDRKFIDNQTLKSLADAFNLSPIERKEFLIAAAGITEDDFCYHKTPEKQLKEMLEILTQIMVPAAILDTFQNVIAINKPYQNLFMVTKELIDYAKQTPINFNLLYVIYSSALGIRDLLGPYWREVGLIQIHQFRRSSFRYRDHDYYKFLVNLLFKEPQFDIDWYASHRAPFDKYQQYISYNYEHPVYGPLNYIGTVTINDTKFGELQLIIYNPVDSVTMATFSQIATSDTRQVVRMAEWPIKLTAR